MLEVTLIDRARRGWHWEVRDATGKLIAHGRQRDRRAAKYQADRALFQLLNVMSQRAPDLRSNTNREVDGRE
jgi:hypothetical protein